MINVELNIKMLLKKLELQTGRDYLIQDVARLSGINRFTVSNLLDGKQDGITLKTIGRLLFFFESEGMPIAISDLFSVTKTGTE